MNCDAALVSPSQSIGIMPAASLPVIPRRCDRAGGKQRPFEALLRMTTHPRIGSAVVVRDGSRILVARRAKPPNLGKWVFPGGKIRPFESIRCAAARELAEETGLDVEIGEQIGAFEIVQPPDEHRIIIYSWARPIGGVGTPASDVSELKWCTRQELAQLDLSDVVSEVARTIGWLDAPDSLAA